MFLSPCSDISPKICTFNCKFITDFQDLQIIAFCSSVDFTQRFNFLGIGFLITSHKLHLLYLWQTSANRKQVENMAKKKLDNLMKESKIRDREDPDSFTIAALPPAGKPTDKPGTKVNTHWIKKSWSIYLRSSNRDLHRTSGELHFSGQISRVFFLNSAGAGLTAYGVWLLQAPCCLFHITSSSVRTWLDRCQFKAATHCMSYGSETLLCKNTEPLRKLNIKDKWFTKFTNKKYSY